MRNMLMLLKHLSENNFPAIFVLEICGIILFIFIRGWRSQHLRFLLLLGGMFFFQIAWRLIMGLETGRYYVSIIYTMLPFAGVVVYFKRFPILKRSRNKYINMIIPVLFSVVLIISIGKNLRPEKRHEIIYEFADVLREQLDPLPENSRNFLLCNMGRANQILFYADATMDSGWVPSYQEEASVGSAAKHLASSYLLPQYQQCDHLFLFYRADDFHEIDQTVNDKLLPEGFEIVLRYVSQSDPRYLFYHLKHVYTP